jgi:hypothetical protein
MANGDLIKLGTFYLNNVKQARPTNPIDGGNIPGYSSGNIEIRDTDTIEANQIYWREVTVGTKKMLIADRCLLRSVTWDTLHAQNLIFGKNITIDGQLYKLRVLTGGTGRRDGGTGSGERGLLPNEWDDIIGREGGYSGLPAVNTGQAGSHNQFWNWFNMYSWCQDTYFSNSATRAVRGYSSGVFWNYVTSGDSAAGIGWRPALEILNTAPLISDSDRDLGGFAAPLVKSYTVSDADGDTFTLVEKLNGVTIRTLNNQTDGNFTLDLTSQWSSLSQASHTVVVEATDQNNAKSTRTWTFTKTNSPPNPPTITGPSNNMRVEQAVDIIFTPSTDQDGDNQYFKVEVANDAGFTSGKQTFTAGLQRFNTDTQTWENVSYATNTDSGKQFKIPVTGLALNSTKYIRVGSTDTSGSNTTSWSPTVVVAVGTVLEVQSIPTETAYMPTRVTIKDKTIIDQRAGTTVEVSNNAFDAVPTWEDMTTEYLAGTNYTFTNTAKTAAKWGISVKYTIQANDSTDEISISAIGMGVS